MDGKRRTGGLSVAIAAYDERLVRVMSNYFLESGAFARCTAYSRGKNLLQELAAGAAFDVLLLDEQLLDMSAVTFMKSYCALEPLRRPAIFVLTRYNYLALCKELRPYGVDQCIKSPTEPALLAQTIHSWCAGCTQIQTLCEQLYRQWDVAELTVNCTYLTEAVMLFLEADDRPPLRKQVFREVAGFHGSSLSAVESSLQRLIQQLKQRDTAEYRAFAARHDPHRRGLTPLRLVQAVAAELRQTLTQKRGEDNGNHRAESDR